MTEEHQTDFIRFKSALLSKEAGDDPFKRAELIKDITASIAIIPDVITRQVYIKDCAERLHMSEQVLTKEVVKLRKQKMEERDKVRTEPVNAPAPSTPEQVKRPVAPVTPKSPLEQNYYNLMQLVVRYGERPIEVDGTIYTIGEVIILSLQNDEIVPPLPVYQTMMDEFLLHVKDANFKAEPFFTFHSDPAVSALAIDMIAEKYQFVKPEQEVRLGERVTQLLFEIKLTVINMQIDQLEQDLKEAQAQGDLKRQFELLKTQPALIAGRNEICKILGNRIISI